MPRKGSITQPRVPCTCRQCGATFYKWPSQIAAGRGHFCSRPCAGAYLHDHPPGQDRDKLLAKKRRYRERHLAEEQERNRRWREANREHCAAKGREWREAHPGEGRADVLRWIANNPERVAAQRRAQAANHRAKKMGAPGHVSTADVVALWERQPVCVVCGNGRGIDHIVEFWQGGTNTPDNIQNLCRSCNVKKTARLRFGKAPE